MSSRKNVPASAVREWFATAQPSDVPAPGSRGRLHPATIAAFHKANKRFRYETASEAEKPTITVPVKVLVNGRGTTRKVTVTTEQARDILGHEAGKRGRFNKGDLALALEAQALATV